ncbi:TIR domain-containing protein [Qipengyuania soli]|uniref:TIR domain-containing protein n=1 Tax=Qipengyuania soli TaxID=2782568 RepID=A0A7S8F3J5_9SPHN|nr:TIR domain-containing protein [Qipengyuania soli]QPC99815.1 TIR domain-containing protein [Qipengyuania soli]
MSDVFISYARKDAAIAGQFAKAFEAQGLEVWWDNSLQTGEVFDEVIEAALRAARAVVVLWSSSSVASRWVRAEATIADRRGTLLPAMIEDCDRPIVFELTHTADLIGWSGDTGDARWLDLLEGVRRLASTRSEADLASVAAITGPKPAQPSSSASQQPSVLILPFVNMSGESAQDYFSDGVSEDIITDMGRIPGMSVVSRNTAFSFKGRTVSPTDLAARLGVTHILEGSVRKAGERVRITAQLFDARSDTQLWAERFDRTLDDIFAIQDEISQSIVAALKLHLAPEDRQAIGQRDATNSEAYELFLIARQFNRTGSERIRPLVIRLCRRVVELDPGFARAWALMSIGEAEMAQRGVPGTSMAQAREWAERAIAADASVAEGHAALAEATLRDAASKSTASAPLVQAALERDPDCYDAHVLAGYLHLAERNYPEAIASFERAIALEPLEYRARGMVMQGYSGLGDEERLKAAARRFITRGEEILKTEPDHGGVLGFMVASLVALGEAEQAIDMTRKAEIFDPENMRLLYNLACAMAQLNEPEMAVRLLGKMADEVHLGWFEWMAVDNDLDTIREDPGFKALMARAAQA